MFRIIDIPSVKTEKEKYVQEEKEKNKETKRFRTNTYNPLVMFDTINSFYSLKDVLLDEFNITEVELQQTNIHCIFHGEVKGVSKPSAVYYSDSDKIYCYSENKQYSAYHALKLAGKNIKTCFDEAWLNIPIETKEEILNKHNENIELEVAEKYKRYNKIFDDFKFGKIDMHKYRNALRKIFIDTYNSDREKKLKNSYRA